MGTEAYDRTNASAGRSRAVTKTKRRHLRAACAVALAASAVAAPGCTSLGSFAGIPSVPVNRVPREFLGRSKEELVETNKLRLRQAPPAVYQLGENDILGIYIENVLGAEDEAPPTHFPEEGELAPSIGFPIPVREDGTVALPLVDPIQVEGLTLNQATESIRKAYTVERRILQPGSDRIIVTLMKRRQHRVLVIREEEGAPPLSASASSRNGGAQATAASSKRGTGYTLNLPAYENDLLHALTETGGMPGLDARNEVIIYRGGIGTAMDHDLMVAQLNNGRGPCGTCIPLPEDPNAIRIPLRFYPEDPPRFTEEDIILADGDVVYIPARDEEKFYTGGVLGGGEFLLPRDYDLDILQAVAIARGPVGASGTGIGGIGGAQSGLGLGGGQGRTVIPPSRAIVLRKVPCVGEIPIRVDLNRALTDPSHRILIMPEDVIIVQYTACEEVINTGLSLIQFNYLLGNGLGR